MLKIIIGFETKTILKRKKKYDANKSTLPLSLNTTLLFFAFPAIPDITSLLLNSKVFTKSFFVF